MGGADRDRQAVGEQRGQAPRALFRVGGHAGQRPFAAPRLGLPRSAAMIRPRTCRSVPCQVCTARLASPATDPASRHRHRSASGHDPQAGARAEQTSAPSSITAAENLAALAGGCGSSESISARSAAVAGSRGSSRPRTTRDSTRRTLVSTTGVRAPNANAATARAVYSPIPGSVSSSATEVRHDAVMLDRDRGGRRVQPQRPAGVAEPLPGPDGGGGGVRGQIGRRRPAREPALVHRQHPDDRGLLQHHLADQDGPRAKPRAAARAGPGRAGRRTRSAGRRRAASGGAAARRRGSAPRSRRAFAGQLSGRRLRHRRPRTRRPRPAPNRAGAASPPPRADRSGRRRRRRPLPAGRC